MNITTTNNAVIIEYNNTTVTGNKGVFTYTYDTPTASVSLFRDSKLMATGALADIRINGESIDETNINEKLNPIFLTFSSGGSINVIDNLNSTSAVDALSANQGRILNETKQETLVSGTNIKTINGNSLLGSGDLSIAGGVGRKIIQVTDTKLRLDPNYDLLYIWDFRTNVPYGNFTMVEDDLTATLNTTNSATIVLIGTGTSSTSMTITFPKNLVYSTEPDAKYFINGSNLTANGSEASVTTFLLKGGEMKVINIYGIGDKRIMEIDY